MAKSAGSFTKGSAAARAAGRKGAVVTNSRRLTAKQQSALNTYYILLIDASGSMRGYEKEVEQTIQQQLATIKANKVGKSFVSIYDFGAVAEPDGNSGACRQLLFKADADTAVYTGYQAVGSTPMYKCMNKAFKAHFGFEKGNNKDAAIMFVITDGQDTDGGLQEVTANIRKAQATDKWTIGAFCPPGATSIFTALGIPPGNVKEWERSKAGFTQMQGQTQVASVFYSQSLRSTGQTKTANLFTPNLATLKTKTVKKELTDRSKDFKSWQVEKEASIQEFVESKNTKFVVGAGYYPLTKPEKVQAYKAVAIVKKGTKEVYTGAEARELLGLPDVDTKVVPGNHGDWDIYVQSTSHNRKLVRGTKLLWDLTHTIDSKHTWAKNP